MTWLRRLWLKISRSRLLQNFVLLRMLGWWFVIVTCMFLAAHVIAKRDSIARLFPSALTDVVVPVLMWLLGMGAGFAFWDLWRGSHQNRQELDGALDVIHRHTKRYWVTASIVMISLGTFVFVFAAIDASGDLSDKLCAFLSASPGGFFAFVTGIMTLFGTLAAIHTIIEMKYTITSYPQLLERVTDLIFNATDNEGVKIVSYSPLPGYWQVASPELRNDFKQKLQMGNRKIQIICLNQQDHIRLLVTIAKIRAATDDPSKTISLHKVIEFQKTCNTILNHFEMTKDENYCQPPFPLQWDKMPPYYFFVSTRKAIIVTPMGLPNISSKIDNELIRQIEAHIKRGGEIDNVLREAWGKEMKSTDPEIQKVRTVTNRARVSTLGFETNDPGIIDALHELFKELSEAWVPSGKSPSAS